MWYGQIFEASNIINEAWTRLKARLVSCIQELSPVLFTLMKSTEPFLDEYYLTDLEGMLKQVGFINVQTALTDPRHRTVTATVPYWWFIFPVVFPQMCHWYSIHCDIVEEKFWRSFKFMLLLHTYFHDKLHKNYQKWKLFFQGIQKGFTLSETQWKTCGILIIN